MQAERPREVWHQPLWGQVLRGRPGTNRVSSQPNLHHQLKDYEQETYFEACQDFNGTVRAVHTMGFIVHTLELKLKVIES